MGHWLDIEIHQQVGQLRTFHHSTTILRGVEWKDARAGSRRCQVEPKPPGGFFLEKKKAKMENKYVEICKDPRHFSSTQKKYVSFFIFGRIPGLLHQKKSSKVPYF